jgi:hypothetical protein
LEALPEPAFSALPDAAPVPVLPMKDEPSGSSGRKAAPG